MTPDPRPEDAPVLLLGATGQVGRFLVPKLLEAGASVIAVSRQVPDFGGAGLTWLQQDLAREPARVQAQVLLSAGPLALALRQARHIGGLRRIVALSSASVLFKRRSPDADERRTIEALIETEGELAELCEKRGIALTLLRPTLIYGDPDRSALARLSEWLESRRRIPIAGTGLRQPVHAGDIASLMVDLVARGEAGAGTYEIGGGETLAYPGFVRRVASAHGVDVHVVRVPAWITAPALRAAHALGLLRSVTPAMVARQRMDLVVDDTDAREKLGWNPRPFRP